MATSTIFRNFTLSNITLIMDKLFLLDAYALIYRAYYAFIKNPRINSKGMNTSAVMGFMNTLHEILSKERPTLLGVAFDHGKTFRDEAFPQYKAQREATPEDIRASVPIIKDILHAMHIPVLQVDGFEADDVIGTLATKAGAEGIATYMLTPDKDYGQLVSQNVFIYRPRHGGGYDVMGPDEVSEKYGISSPEQVIDLLALMGDSADNFPGCPGVGEKTAVKLITQFGDIDTLLSNTADIKGKLREKVEAATDDIRMSRFLATIRCDVPIALDLDALRIKDIDEAELQKIFAELEFSKLADKFIKKGENKQKTVKPQLDLFGTNTNDEADDAENLFKNEVKTLCVNIQTADNAAIAKEKIDFFLSKQILGIEVEGQSSVPVSLSAITLSASEAETVRFVLPADPAERQAMCAVLRQVLEDEKIEKAGHDLKQHLKQLSAEGLTLKGQLFDVMLAHYVLQPELKHDLPYLSDTLLHLNTEGTAPGTLAHVSLLLAQHLATELDGTPAKDVFTNIDMPLVPVLAQMELYGVRLDTKALADVSITFNARLNDIEQEIYTLAGESFNIASPKQVGEILFGKMQLVEKPKKTKTGQYVTSEEVLQQLAHQHPIVQKILQHRGLKKLLGTYVDALPLLTDAHSHLHTTFNQAVTATGRLSSSNPNLQNIPVRGDDGKEIRRCFVPDEHCRFFSADYSQIELRVMAHLSQDEHLISAFRSGHDIHAATAAKIYKVPIEEVTRDQRTRAKRANFGIIYGITTFGLAERLDISRAEAKALIDGYFESFPKVYEYMERAKAEAREKGYAETLFGRRRYLPDINSHNGTVRAFAERNAINAPIQGTAADIIKMAMARIYKAFHVKQLQSKMILQVHDELNFSVVPGEELLVEEIVLNEMEHIVNLSVPLVADSGWGDNWLEAH